MKRANTARFFIAYNAGTHGTHRKAVFSHFKTLLVLDGKYTADNKEVARNA